MKHADLSHPQVRKLGLHTPQRRHSSRRLHDNLAAVSVNLMTFSHRRRQCSHSLTVRFFNACFSTHEELRAERVHRNSPHLTSIGTKAVKPHGAASRHMKARWSEGKLIKFPALCRCGILCQVPELSA